MDLRDEAAPGAPAAGGGRAVPGLVPRVETLLLGVHDGRLTYRPATIDLVDSRHPDTAALHLAGFADGFDRAGGRLLHSTSWRFTDGRIVLTYAALPDPDPGTATPVEAPVTPAQGADPLVPSPPHIERIDVVAHACRHLAFLRRTDPVVAAAAARQPSLWALLDTYRPDVAVLRQARPR